MGKTPEKALDLIREFESCLRRVKGAVPALFAPYLDPIGIPTLGWGSIKYPNGRKVTMKDPPRTSDECDALFAWEIETESEPGVDRLVKVPLHPYSYGALVSFAYNLGAGNLSHSTLLRMVNERRWDRVRGEFMQWRMAGGKVLRGLERRRAAEADLFLLGVALAAKGVAVEPVPVPSAPAPLPEVDAPVTTAPARRSFGDLLNEAIAWLRKK